jgi:hypothetical protein
MDSGWWCAGCSLYTIRDFGVGSRGLQVVLCVPSEILAWD